MDERDRFESWFRGAFGARPVGDIADLQRQAEELQDRINGIKTWETEHRAALTAWHERHNRKEKT
jgi:hypothetical protein